MAQQVRAHAVIHGRVQGVWFRMETRQAAERIGNLTGWVRNVPDGTVEALIEGDKKNVEKLLEWCRQGPPLARVDRVDVAWDHPTGDLPDFDVTF